MSISIARLGLVAPPFEVGSFAMPGYSERGLQAVGGVSHWSIVLEVSQMVGVRTHGFRRALRQFDAHCTNTIRLRISKEADSPSNEGEMITADDIASASVTVRRNGQSVYPFVDLPLDPEQVLFPARGWSVDGVGHNFELALPPAAFAGLGLVSVEFLFELADQQVRRLLIEGEVVGVE